MATRTQTPSHDDELYEEGHELRMGLFEHLDELRMRVTRIFIWLVAGTVIGFAFTGPTLNYLRQPYCDIVPAAEECRLVTLGPTDGVIIYLRVSLLIGAILAIPAITYQSMAFVVPGLTRKEKRYIFMSIPAITLLFFIGIAFSWFILLPPALGFLEGFQEGLFRNEWTADLYM
ncbi:MAG: twin-arginine translocase subunit TatC, partial [Aggregatilineales bacterium]